MSSIAFGGVVSKVTVDFKIYESCLESKVEADTCSLGPNLLLLFLLT